MRTIANLVWLLSFGWLSALSWAIAGFMCYVLVILAPFGPACWRLAQFALYPVGRELVDARLLGERRIPGTFLAQIVWVLLAGWWLALLHAVMALCCLAACAVVVTIPLALPLALGAAQLAVASLAPLGKRIVDKEVAKALRVGHYLRRAGL
ncbi:MAG: hypothetical protein NZ899_15065 [Thermoguttaceae bacterium]|nr:hypothetical protein [Thermoguttaceae bacterium]MDW8080245.1 YccF domain-containing protein [Thermoguttaceae bacterium]